MNPETRKKIEAAKTCISVLMDAGLEAPTITIKPLQDEEVKKLSEHYRQQLMHPSTISPYYWTWIQLGSSKIYLQGTTKNLKQEWI